MLHSWHSMVTWIYDDIWPIDVIDVDCFHHPGPPSP